MKNPFKSTGTPEKRKAYLEEKLQTTHYANLLRGANISRDWGSKYRHLFDWNHKHAKEVFGKADFQFMGEHLYRGHFLTLKSKKHPGKEIEFILISDPTKSGQGSTLEIYNGSEQETKLGQEMLEEILEALHKTHPSFTKQKSCQEFPDGP